MFDYTVFNDLFQWLVKQNSSGLKKPYFLIEKGWERMV